MADRPNVNRFRNASAVIALAGTLAAAGCGSATTTNKGAAVASSTTTTTARAKARPPSSDAREPLTEAAAEKLGEKARERIDTEAAAFTAIAYFSKQKAWKKVDHAINKTLRPIRPARSEFLAFGDYRDTKPIYKRLLAADDAMRKYVALYEADRPPYGPDEFDKATRLADAAADWVREMRAAYRAFRLRPPPPLRQPGE
jgi:hypothetical protein